MAEAGVEERLGKGQNGAVDVKEAGEDETQDAGAEDSEKGAAEGHHALPGGSGHQKDDGGRQDRHRAQGQVNRINAF